MVETREEWKWIFNEDRKPETGNRRPETGDRKPETGDRRPETGDGRPETGNRRRETGNGRPETGDRRPDLSLRNDTSITRCIALETVLKELSYNNHPAPFSLEYILV